MKRWHLCELEDQPWLPTTIRDAVTEVLREALVVGGRVYAPAVPLLARLVAQCGQRRVVDLCFTALSSG